MIEPITYVILNHGRFGEELIKSAELIAGKTEHIHAVSLLSGMSIEEYYEEVRDYLTGVQGEILVLADLYGGTPSNVGMMLQREFSLHVVCGIHEEALWILTAYWPDLEHWNVSYTERRKKGE